MSATCDLSDPSLYFNRELSWLEFNRRVLEEAQDSGQPLLERVRFLCIVSSNLDEFFEIRMAGLKQQIESGVNDTGADGLSAAETFRQCRDKVLRIIEDQFTCWQDDVRPLLTERGIVIHSVKDLKSEARTWADNYFTREVFPVLTPLAVDSSHPFPQLRNKSHNLILLLRRPDHPHELSYGVVQIPAGLPRLIALPRESEGGFDYLLLKDLVQAHAQDLFPGVAVEAAYAFRITRNSDLYFDEEEADNLLRTIAEELRKRNRGNAVRLEVEHDCPPAVRSLLLEVLHLESDDLYLIKGPINFLHLNPVGSLDAFPELRDRPWVPVESPDLPAGADTFEVMRQKDILLHHPYESFQSVVDFVHRSANDPRVLAIKLTLYRTSGDSPIVDSLIEAARNGKQVTALVELRARFDEANNIRWAKLLEEAGCHVVYGVVGLKTHSKMLMVVRRDEDRIRHYVHLGTGNYHPTTARFYTDIGMLTTNPVIGQEVATLFNTLTGLSDFRNVSKLLVAPFELADRFEKLIDREIAFAKAGRPARVIVKVNSLVDSRMIRALYRASQAGVKVECIVRGICCLRPGMEGVSDNIRVVSIIGRFLEHSRIFYFANDGSPEVYLGSADWMPRNLYRRVEVCFPVDDARLKDRLVNEIIPTFLQDNNKAREMQPDGSYQRVHPAEGEQTFQAQLTLRRLARGKGKSSEDVSFEDPRRFIKPLHGGNTRLQPRMQPPVPVAQNPVFMATPPPAL